MVNYKLQRRKFLSFASLLPLFIFNSGLRANDIYSIEKVLEPRYMGNVNAPIKFTEFVSFTCSHCADFHINKLPSIKEKYIDKTVLYISAEKFTQQYVDSVKKNSRNDFIHFYQLIDVLIIDDVHFFSGKSGTQDVFFHIFNHLHQNGKQVILTSDKAPVDMQDIEQRLLSRFKWGLSAELQQPNFETRERFQVI